jgi:hypothetical protein
MDSSRSDPYRVCPIRAGITEHEWLRIADTLVLNHVEIHVEPIGAKDGDTSLELLAGAESGECGASGTFLITRADVVVVKRAIAVRVRTSA